jgi:hypothetical protein
MFRLLGQRAFIKAVPRPVSRLSNSIGSRWIHNVRLPYTGPPSYDTIERRFSSDNVDPHAYFTAKREQEAIDRGQWVDLHDIGYEPEDYDVLFTDINHETLEKMIAEEVGIPYLSKPTVAEANEVVKVGTGYMHGKNRCTIVPFIVGHREEARWVFFIVDSTAPYTYLSIRVSV